MITSPLLVLVPLFGASYPSLERMVVHICDMPGVEPGTQQVLNKCLFVGETKNQRGKLTCGHIVNPWHSLSLHFPQAASPHHFSLSLK